MQSTVVPGAFVWIRRQRWRVLSVYRQDGTTRIEVASPHGTQVFLAPFDRVWTGEHSRRPRRVRPSHFRARLADIVGRAATWRTPRALVGADIQLLPHQLEPLIAVCAGARRLLIADEVGLGKTIQAGILIAELHRRNPVARTLVLAPAALRHQWADEIAVRFRLRMRHAEAESLSRFARDELRARVPWHHPGVWMATADFVKQPHVFDAVADRPWDLLVIDEAHSVCGQSERHTAAAELAARSRMVVLLTATPHGGDDQRFQRLLALGAHAADDDIAVFRRTRADTGMARQRRVHWRAILPLAEESRVFDTLIPFERAVLSCGAEHRNASILLLAVLRKRALSTAAALLASVRRRLEWLDRRPNADDDWRQPSLWTDEDDDSLTAAEHQSLMGHVGLTPQTERDWLTRLQALASRAATDDSKLAHIAGVLRRTDEPVVIFTEFRDSLVAVVDRIGSTRRVAMVHGGQTVEDQQHQVRRFTSGDASVLVATDVAGQGLNLQARCRWVMNVELPWTPTRLQQRAGRVDRIGQTRRVHVSTLTWRHVVESPVLVRLARRMLCAQHALGTDLFDSLLPDEASMREHVIMAVPLGQPEIGRHVSMCLRWRRAARVAATQTIRRRVWTRGHAGLAARPCWADASRLPAWRPTIGADSGLLFSVPLVDRTWSVVEERLVCVRVPCAIHVATRDQAVHAAAQRIAAAHVEPRRRRLERLRRAEEDAAIEREQRMAERRIGGLRWRHIQPGLFDRRTIVAADIAAETSARIRHDVDAFAARSEQSCTIDVGSPVLLAAIGSRA